MALDNFHDVPVDASVGTKDLGRLTQFLSLQFDNIRRMLIKRPQFLLLDTATHSNIADTAEQTLLAATVPARNFIHPNTVLRLEAIVTTIDGAATKQFTIKAGGIIIFDSGVFSGVNKNLYAQVYILATGPTTQNVGVVSSFHNSAPSITFTPVTIDFTSDVVISYNAVSGTAVAGQINLRHACIKYGRV